MTISTLVQRRARMPPVPDRPPASFNTSLMSVFEMCSAGARPKMIAVPRHTTEKNATTLPSIVK